MSKFILLRVKYCPIWVYCCTKEYGFMISTPTKMNSDYQFLMLTIHSIILSLFLIFRLRQRRCFYVILASFLPTHSSCLVVPWWSNIRYFDSHRTLDILERRHPRFISTGGTWFLIFWFFWKDFVHVTFPVVVCWHFSCIVHILCEKMEMGTTLGRGYTLGIFVWPRSIWSCGIVDQIETFFFPFLELP